VSEGLGNKMSCCLALAAVALAKAGGLAVMQSCRSSRVLPTVVTPEVGTLLSLVFDLAVLN